MKELLEPLLKSREDWKVAAMTRKPDPGSEAYSLGFAQGKYAGLTEAVHVLERVFEDQDEKERER